MMFRKRFFCLALTALWLLFLMPGTSVLADELTDLVAGNKTMTFSGGAGEPGFSFTNWSGNNNTIWPANLASPSRITSTSGPFDIISFDSQRYKSADVFAVKSNLGHTKNWTPPDSLTPIELNWEGVTWVEFYRPQGGSNPSPDFDNLVYRMKTEEP